MTLQTSLGISVHGLCTDTDGCSLTADNHLDQPPYLQTHQTFPMTVQLSGLASSHLLVFFPYLSVTPWKQSRDILNSTSSCGSVARRLKIVLGSRPVHRTALTIIGKIKLA